MSKSRRNFALAFGNNGSQACKGGSAKDIEKAYNRQEVVQENERASAKEFLVNSGSK